MTAPILLKIFSGPHTGAEIPLTPGTVTLGSGNSCDIILQDSTVAERHLRILVPEGPDLPENLTITSMDEPVVLMGGARDVEPALPADETAPRPEGESTEPPADSVAAAPESAVKELKPGDRLVDGEGAWPPLTPLTLGTTCIAWKRADQKWKSVDVSGLFFSQAESAPVADGGEPDGPGADADARKTIPLPGIVSKTLKGLGLILLFMFIFGPCMGTKDTRLAKDMRKVLDREGYGFLVVTQTNIGVTVLGTVESQQDRSRLWQIAGRMEYPVFLDVRVNEERAYAVKVALSVRGLFPEIALRERDIIMKGYMRDKLIEGAAKIWVRNDISEVDTIESKMVYGFQVWPVLKDRLIKHKLDKLIIVRFHPGLVQVEGELDFDQRETLETVKEEVCNALNSPIAFWDTLTAPGFSPEWNQSLNASLRSRFAPDAGLAQLYLDSQSSKGLPAFIASTPEFRVGESAVATTPMETPVSSQSALTTAPGIGPDLEKKVEAAEKITDPEGNRLAVIRDKDGNLQGAVLLDEEGKIKRTPDGSPIVLPVLKDKKGEVITDKEGKPVFSRPLKDAEGNLIYTEEKPGSRPVPAKDGDGRILVDDQGRIITGDVLRDDDGTIQRDEQGNILVRDKDGNIVPARPGATDDDGRILVDDQGRIITGDVLRDDDGTIQRDEQGNILVRDKDGNIVAARPGATDDDGRILVDDQGRIITGDVLRDDDGTIQRDEQGNILVRDKDGNIVAAQPLAAAPPAPKQQPIITGPVLDKDGKVIYDKEGKPVTGRIAFDEDGQVIRDSEGKPVVMGVALDEKGKPQRDADGELIPLTVARDADGNVVRDEQGNPLLVPALVDKDGRIVRDSDGRPVAPRVITGTDSKAVYDKDGRLILDQDANKALIPSDQADTRDSVDQGGTSAAGPSDTSTGEQDRAAVSDKQVFGSGRIIEDKFDKEAPPEDPLGGMTVVGITLNPIPFVSMKDGQKFFTGGKLPSGYVIRKIGTDRLELEKNKKTIILSMRHE